MMPRKVRDLSDRLPREQPSSMWTPEEAGRVMGNRVNQPHYVEWIVRKCIERTMAGRKGDLLALCEAANALCRGRFGVPLNDKTVNKSCHDALMRDAAATVEAYIRTASRTREMAGS